MRFAIKLLTILTGLLPFSSAFAQKPQQDTSALKFGIHVGYYLTGDGTAEYYSGHDNGRLRNMLALPQTEQQIKESLGGYNFDIEEYAKDMRYNNVASFELDMSYAFGNNWFFAAHLHNVKLTAAGVFTLRVERVDPNNTVKTPLEQVGINGKESRSHLQLGLGKRFPIDNHFHALASAGVDLNFVEVKENRFNVQGRTYNIPTYTDALNQQASNTSTFGSGFYATAGLGFQPAQYGFLVKCTYINTNISVNDVVESKINIFIPSVGFSIAF